MSTSMTPAVTRVVRQRGASLIIVMVILVIASLLGLAAAQISLQGERGARNDRDMQMALQSANLALQDANAEIFGKSSNGRPDNFAVDNSIAFAAGCGRSGNQLGLCQQAAEGAAPAWLSVDLADDTRTVLYGKFTQHHLTLPETAGPQPAKAPRYVIERISPFEQGANLAVESGQRQGADQAAWFRITAMGFGPRDDILAVTQAVVRKP